MKRLILVLVCLSLSLFTPVLEAKKDKKATEELAPLLSADTLAGLKLQAGLSYIVNGAYGGPGPETTSASVRTPGRTHEVSWNECIMTYVRACKHG